MDGEVQRLKRRAYPGEGTRLVQRVHKNLGSITDRRLAGLTHQHQCAMFVVVVRDGLGMPGDIFGTLSKKIVLSPGRPESCQLVFEEAPILQRVSGTAFGFLNDLFSIDGII